MKHLLTFLAAVSIAGGAAAHEGHHRGPTIPPDNQHVFVGNQHATTAKPYVDDRQSTLLTNEPISPRDEAMKSAEYAYAGAVIAAKFAVANKAIAGQALTELPSAEDRAFQALQYLYEAYKAKDDGLFLTRQFFANYAFSELIRLVEGKER